MSDTVIEAKPANPKADKWADRIAVQRRSGISVKPFCKEQGLTDYSFYASRRRLLERGPARFALMERSAPRQEHHSENTGRCDSFCAIPSQRGSHFTAEEGGWSRDRSPRLRLR